MDPRLELADQVVPGVSGVLSALDAVKPVIHVSDAASPAARAAAVALLAMVGRVHPEAEIEGYGPVGRNPWGIGELSSAREILAGAFPTPSSPAHRIIRLGFGHDVDADLWIGGGDWNVILSGQPAVVEDCSLGLGLHASASFAAAELLRRALEPLGFVRPEEWQVEWNLFDHSRQLIEPQAFGTPRPVRLLVLGGGSVGSSVVGVLICAGPPTGTAVVVDGDALDPAKNPFRYPTCTGGENYIKGPWLAEALREAGWDAAGHPSSIRDWAKGAPQPGWDGIAVSSVDTVDGRLEAADVLARITLSAAVDGLTLHVQREHLGDGFRCPYCDFVDLGSEVSRAGVIAEHVGLPEQRVIELQRDDQLTDADLASAVAAGKLQAELAASLVGCRLADLVNRIYAEAQVTLPASGQVVAVSAPFVSWITGTLAVAEITKSALGLSMVDRRVELDMAGGPQGYVHRRRADSSGRCFCAPGRVRARWMARLYPEPPG